MPVPNRARPGLEELERREVPSTLIPWNNSSVTGHLQGAQVTTSGQAAGIGTDTTVRTYFPLALNHGLTSVMVTTPEGNLTEAGAFFLIPVLPGVPGLYYDVEPFLYLNGTGRFAGAKGFGLFAGTFNLFTNTAVGSGHGEILVPGG